MKIHAPAKGFNFKPKRTTNYGLLILIIMAIGVLVYALFQPKTITVIDGCEYIVTPYPYSLTHKGNCTNSVHIYN